MNLMTITEISKNFNISTRTLRYYEQIGLLKSVKKDDYAYRTYDDAAVLRLQQIVVLRKLRIPLKQIVTILESKNASEIIETFRQNLNEVDDEITALSTIRTILNTFITRLNENTNLDIKVGLLDDISILDVVDSLTVTKIAFKEEKTMEYLNKASGKLEKLEDKDVRVVYLPPSTVASAHYVGQECEMHSSELINNFVNENNLIEIKPDLRTYGFNNPIQCAENTGMPSTGYELWVTIPDDMEVTAPLRKIKFHGGLYAAHCIRNYEFDHWNLLGQWVNESNLYDHDWGSKRCTPYMDEQDWAMEETLNFYNRFLENDPGGHQLDLLFPIKPKFAASIKHPQEKIIDTFNYNGASVEVVEWSDTIWCGRIGYAENNAGELNVEDISNGFLSQNHASMNERDEPDWNVLLNINHLSPERPNGLIFAFLVGSEHQPDGFDVYKLPAGQYMRIAMTDESAKALDAPLWNGGPPPYEWIGERLAPQFGYKYGHNTLPIIEYYGLENGRITSVISAWLYVPVEKM